MSRKFLLLWVMLFAWSTAPVWAQGGTMTDQQVMEYVEMGMQQGKSQQQIATELARRGVTREQAQRVKLRFEQRQQNGQPMTTEIDRSRNKQSLDSEKELMGSDFSFESDNQKTGKITRFITNQEIGKDQTLTLRMDENGNLVSDTLTIFKEEVQEEQVFGRNIFNTSNLTFEPGTNLPTPANYRLGAGDQVTIDIWGTHQASIQQTISPDGAISIDGLGLVFLNGMSVEQATGYLKKELNKIYAGLSGENPTSQIKVSLGNSRTIQVNVMGEVYQPGTYAISAFSTVFHALYSAGGVSDIGSLRNIQVMRNGRNIANVDVYEFIMNGKTKDDITLQEGDVIIVSPYEALVKIEGNVKRPMKYEMKGDETVATLLKYAGNFSSNAYTRSMKLVRQNGKEYQIFTVDDMDYSVFKLKDGDVLTAEAILNRYENKLEIKGAVYRPGIYQFGGDLNTVKQLIEKADGVMADAFLARAVLHRQREDLTREIIQVDMKGILNGTKPDIALQRNDVLYVPSIHDLQDFGNVQVFGEVARPGRYVYADNMTLEDLIIQAGGLLESASSVRVDVSRRIKDNKSTEASATIGEMFTFALKDGFVIDGEQGFLLEPYDQVFVRRSPAYQTQVNVRVNGEVLYGGTYALTQKAERVSSLIQKAGGLTPYAYAKGAKITRQINAEERRRMETVLDMARTAAEKDSIDMSKLELGAVYYVGIDLEEALRNPGGDADVVLREGDELIIPEYNNTVRISGDVMYPNTVSYVKGKTLKYYIEQAGDYGQTAKKSKAYIVCMNGQVKKANKNDRDLIEPGCEIIVPTKQESSFKLQNILSIATTSASLATMIASIANILTK